MQQGNLHLSISVRISVMHPDQQLGFYIRDRRINRHMSQARLAWELGRTRSFISRVENGQTLNPYLLPKVAHVLGVDVQSLINPPGTI
jgi:transcriptional regulator with XRE-family HTH domain